MKKNGAYSHIGCKWQGVGSPRPSLSVKEGRARGDGSEEVKLSLGKSEQGEVLF